MKLKRSLINYLKAILNDSEKLFGHREEQDMGGEKHILHSKFFILEFAREMLTTLQYVALIIHTGGLRVFTTLD